MTPSVGLLQPLERRLLMSAEPAPAAVLQNVVRHPAVAAEQVEAAGGSSAALDATGSASASSINPSAASIPGLSSRPSARVKLYLEFDGDYTTNWGSYRPGSTPAFDRDGNSASFSSSEAASMREIWERVAEKFSPFNLDVTTRNPGNLADRQALRVVIGGSGDWAGGGGGIGYVGGFFNHSPNTVYVFADNLGGGDPAYTAEAAAHEAGHGFGLEHQALWSGGKLVDEYNPGTAERAPILGASYGAARGLWWRGTASSSAWEDQDDLSILASSKNGFGYRADDHAGNLAGARFLSGSSLSASGVIERTSDVDSFSFTTGAGNVWISARPFAKGGMLDLKLTLRRSDGAVVATASSSSLSESISRTLKAGKYILEVASQGGYGDVGQYSLQAKTATAPSATPIPPIPPIAPIPQPKPTSSKPLPAAPRLPTATAVSSTAVRLTWRDKALNEMGFKIERTTDRVYWSQVGTAGANARSATVRGLKPGTLYYFRIRSYGSAGNSAFAKVVQARTARTAKLAKASRADAPGSRPISEVFSTARAVEQGVLDQPGDLLKGSVRGRRPWHASAR